MRFFEKQYKALANKRRLEILKFLKTRHQATVGQIAKKIKLKLKSTSKHLGKLSEIDALMKEQKGLNVFYRLSRSQKPIVKNFLKLI